jgi:hypothetical protein
LWHTKRKRWGVMATNSFQKTLEDFQIKIMEHSVEEARIKKEKAMERSWRKHNEA